MTHPAAAAHVKTKRDIVVVGKVSNKSGVVNLSKNSLTDGFVQCGGLINNI